MAKPRMLSHEEVAKMLKTQVPPSECTQIETMRYAVQSVLSVPFAPVSMKDRLVRFGISEFEAFQLINHPPAKILDLYVVVEELEERLSTEVVEEIIKMFSAYVE
ncbi:hypothetical protein NEHOM01_0687 [Nematocida homosporus]|uniref:uncharacterized protein n=1 Tax=Nematocida homosporus TaxID=1912981 RepID=UPI00221E84A2|nr:uncharacterized protein NEHOM01_0687 [Nematocida homosporus]KAI5185229.1 hypothetical protein NEHOM01_0687 [Nematocida homosporus]